MNSVYEALLVSEHRRGDMYRNRALRLARIALSRKSAFRVLKARYDLLKAFSYGRYREVDSLGKTIRKLNAEIEKLKDDRLFVITRHAREVEECRDTTGRPLGKDWARCLGTELENKELRRRNSELLDEVIQLKEDLLRMIRRNEPS